MKVPSSAAADVQQAFRDLHQQFEGLSKGNPDWHGRRFLNVGDAVNSNEWLTQYQYKKQIVEDLAEIKKTLTDFEKRIFALENP